MVHYTISEMFRLGLAYIFHLSNPSEGPGIGKCCYLMVLKFLHGPQQIIVWKGAPNIQSETKIEFCQRDLGATKSNGVNIVDQVSSLKPLGVASQPLASGMNTFHLFLRLAILFRPIWASFIVQEARTYTWPSNSLKPNPSTDVIFPQICEYNPLDIIHSRFLKVLFWIPSWISGMIPLGSKVCIRWLYFWLKQLSSRDSLAVTVLFDSFSLFFFFLES